MATYSVTCKQADNDIRIAMPDTARAFNWLRYGWSDLARTPRISIPLGNAFTLLCLAAYAAVATQPTLSATVSSVLLSTSPFIAAAAYFVVQQHEQNRPPSLQASIVAVPSRAVGIGLFSALSALIVGAWERLSSITFALYYGTLGDGAAQLERPWTAGFELASMLVFLIITGVVLAYILFAVGAIVLPTIAKRTARSVVKSTKGVRTLYQVKCLATFVSDPLFSWRPLARDVSSTSANRNMDTGIPTKQYHRLLIPLLACWLVLFQQSVHASNDKALTALVTKAEQMAVREVLSPSDMAIFDAVEPIPLLGFITPMNVMSPEVRDRIRQRAAAIIRSELEQLERGLSSRPQTTREQLGAALQIVNVTGSIDKTPESQLVKFSQYIRESNMLARDSHGGTISLYEASLLLERWGVDPYGFEAHPYYCALGIKSLDTMNVYVTKFCS